MKNKLLIISLFYLLNSLPSDDIWNKVISFNSEYTLIDNIFYYIFQEKDFCKRDIHSEDMKKL